MMQTLGSEWGLVWPELFVALTVSQRRILDNAIADNVLEGWEPTRADVEDLIGFVRGDLSIADYIERVRADLSVR